MTTVCVTIGVFAAVMAGMAVGVIFSNKELKGSCGGVGGSCACEEAGTPGACKVPDAHDGRELKAPGQLIEL